ncbi:hypothetical protein CVT25_005201 [Psilocybe cyanescens]|uniref:Uncharacterized protein n=1 Tax=Psilocybe cyanescens TaxID=93625 RepID=A0A409XE13_PSICY|nr:hypothetical protein CVT25_005201 [Psilocybe cyanescens]
MVQFPAACDAAGPVPSSLRLLHSRFPAQQQCMLLALCCRRHRHLLPRHSTGSSSQEQQPSGTGSLPSPHLLLLHSHPVPLHPHSHSAQHSPIRPHRPPPNLPKPPNPPKPPKPPVLLSSPSVSISISFPLSLPPALLAFVNESDAGHAEQLKIFTVAMSVSWLGKCTFFGACPWGCENIVNVADVSDEEREGKSGGDVDIAVDADASEESEEMDEVSDGGASCECGMPSMEFDSEASVDTGEEALGGDDRELECEYECGPRCGVLGALAAL